MKSLGVLNLPCFIGGCLVLQAPLTITGGVNKKERQAGETHTQYLIDGVSPKQKKAAGEVHMNEIKPRTVDTYTYPPPLLPKTRCEYGLSLSRKL